MTPRADEAPALVARTELAEVELIILRRLREYTLGDHRSLFHGPGFDYVGLRDWQPGDRMSAVDWPQSSLTNFSPLIVRDFEQPGTASVVVVADRSCSTRCGTDGVPIAEAVAWAVGSFGMSAVFFQDTFGLITFDRDFSEMATVAPKLGRNQVIHCLDAYQHGRGLEPMHRAGHVGHSIGSTLRRTSLVPVVSDFLFEDVETVLQDLAHLNAVHDVFIVIVDASAAYALPPASAGWIQVHDVESGRRQLLSRGAVKRLIARTQAWQDQVARAAAAQDLDVVRIGPDKDLAAVALAEFTAERRLRKK
jgi:uncharacterized protein (DUF58 family)